MLSDQALQALHLLRGWKLSLKEEMTWVWESTIHQYNQALGWLAIELGQGILGFRFEDSELRPVYGNRSTGERQVLWGIFMSKLNGALGFADEKLAASVPDPSQTQPIERHAPMNNKIWVIHGHDHKARDVIFALLSAVGLQPLEFDPAADLTGKPSPSIMEILQAAFREGQAFVALFTPDEEAVPSAAFAESDDPGPHPQPRPNVVPETGMAFAYDPDRTIIVEMGRVREISDLSGIHSVKWRHDNVETRRRFLRKLRLAKAPLDDSGDHWMRAGGMYP